MKREEKDLPQSQASNRKRARGSRPMGEAARYLVIMEEMGPVPPGQISIGCVKISILRIIDVYSHHLSCHFNRQLHNSQFYFPTWVFRRSVNLNNACFPSFYIRICFLIWVFPLDFGGDSFYISNNIFCILLKYILYTIYHFFHF